MDAIETAAAVRSGDARAEDVVEECLARAEAWQPATNAWKVLWPEEALAAARSGDRDRPLAGVPVAVKDLFDVAGHDSTGCSNAIDPVPAARDAVLVSRLREAGAIPLGKANMHELAAGGTGQVSACGPAWNPWDPARITGGSSSGSAAAVASGAVPLAMGSDTGGSIRIPGSLCGVVGLKPTHGRLPVDGMMALGPSMDCPGPMARTVADAALAFAILVGEPVTRMENLGGVKGLRVAAVRRGLYGDRVHPDQRAALEHVADVLAAEGADVGEGELPGIEDAPHVWTDLAWAEFVATYPDLDLDRIAPQVRGLYEHGRDLDPLAHDAGAARRPEIRETFLSALRDADAILVPATPYPAPRADEEEVDVGDGQTMNVYKGGPAWLTRPVSLTGLPALAVPAGFDARGLPLGVQLVGRPDEEWTLLDLGAIFQRATEHHLREPSLPAS